jgi:hypothetical protein
MRTNLVSRIVTVDLVCEITPRTIDKIYMSHTTDLLDSVVCDCKTLCKQGFFIDLLYVHEYDRQAILPP